MIHLRATSALCLVVTALLAASPVLAAQTPDVADIAVHQSSSVPSGAPIVGSELGGLKEHLAEIAPAPTMKHFGPDLHAMKPVCHTGTILGVMAASQVVNALVVTAADDHLATQRVAPYGQPKNALLPLGELALEDYVVSKALGWSHASCRTQSTVWCALTGAAIYNSAATSSGSK
jgi:hypothetical protein